MLLITSLASSDPASPSVALSGNPHPESMSPSLLGKAGVWPRPDSPPGYGRACGRSRAQQAPSAPPSSQADRLSRLRGHLDIILQKLSQPYLHCNACFCSLFGIQQTNLKHKPESQCEVLSESPATWLSSCTSAAARPAPGAVRAVVGGPAVAAVAARRPGALPATTAGAGH